ncbi:MAG: hypothetical protein AUJ52_12305 [Elusimicrobia bacterium CG1_02_63_36]|nr:MAG: hypothetical protein AUJ52_12305 [Elusimicrobia bacterium CG1_02_63_36]PJA15594.1 MAG: hypothetical protein COX66_09755 [Elusimicrobia bacterium CG_4_10_14_0_2_um_filter_63_34]PJB26527.1 MAG: hypothetical protein CO113_03145 [Elusimicrobia bacterium CG_4_9_14_3_um_filter_62_55]
MLGLCFLGGFSGCGGSSADATQLANEREARKNEIDELQKKQNAGTITPEEEARLAQLYKELEEEGENPADAG